GVQPLFFSSRRRHTRFSRDWSSDVCSSDLTDNSDRWLRRRMVPIRSRIIATEELPEGLMATLMPKLMMCSETRNLGFYYRPSPEIGRASCRERLQFTLGLKAGK